MVDHIIAKQHQGKSTGDNLALCCGFCNLHKGPNVSGIALETGTLVPLFHPRRDRWREHFRRKGPWIEGRTLVGKVTIQVLAMNHPLQVARRSVVAEND